MIPRLMLRYARKRMNDSKPVVTVVSATLAMVMGPLMLRTDSRPLAILPTATRVVRVSFQNWLNASGTARTGPNCVWRCMSSGQETD